MTWSIHNDRKFIIWIPNLSILEETDPMPLTLLSKIFISGAARRPAALLALAACALTGCISSSGPILGDAKAILGDRIQIHRFTPGKSGGRTHAMGIFEWVGGRYIPRSGSQGHHRLHRPCL